jgi:hypothetical protein
MSGLVLLNMVLTLLPVEPRWLRPDAPLEGPWCGLSSCNVVMLQDHHGGALWCLGHACG